MKESRRAKGGGKERRQGGREEEMRDEASGWPCG